MALLTLASEYWGFNVFEMVIRDTVSKLKYVVNYNKTNFIFDLNPISIILQYILLSESSFYGTNSKIS